MKKMKLGVLGGNLGHSKSPQIQNAGIKYLGLDASYEKFEIDPDDFSKDIAKLLSELDGINVTIPYKEDIVNYLNKADELVNRIGASNTLIVKKGYIEGTNTDYFGFMESLKGFDLKSKKVAVLGAGGASRAVLVALDDIGVDQINIYVRNIAKAKETRFPRIKKANREILLFNHESDFSGIDLVINCTPVGQGRLVDSSPLEKEHLASLKDSSIVYDLVYEKTELLKQAEAKGLKTIDGSEMLILQAAKSLSLWSEEKLTDELIDVMRKAFK
jgi:shikimate dehydrogenase